MSSFIDKEAFDFYRCAIEFFVDMSIPLTPWLDGESLKNAVEDENFLNWHRLDVKRWRIDELIKFCHLSVGCGDDKLWEVIWYYNLENFFQIFSVISVLEGCESTIWF